MDQRHTTSFRPDIEGLRAVAVILVLTFHSGAPLFGGFVGVDVFFVISGFLITSLLLREVMKTGRISLTDFYARRAKRLLPTASLVLVATGVATRLLAPSGQRATFGGDLAASAAYFVNWRFATRSVDYLAEGFGRSPVLHFWSLSVEEQFYFVWPLLIGLAAFVARKATRERKWPVATGLSVVFFPSLVWSVLFSKQDPSQAFFVTTTRLWELGVGAWLALLLPNIAKLPRAWGKVLTAVGACLIAVTVWRVRPESCWPGFLAIAPTLGAAFVIAGGTLDRGGPISALLSWRPMVWIGGLSYGIYLWHWPILVIGQDWLGLTGPRWGGVLGLASVLPAWLTFRFVETPIRFARSLEGRARRVLPLGIAASLICAALGLALARSATPGDPLQGVQVVTLQVRSGRVVTSPRGLGAGAWSALGGMPAAEASAVGVVPPPSRATEDVPRAYADKCQVSFTGVRPKWCRYGDRKGQKKVVLAGDSKILQYVDALDVIGRARGWSITTATKSSCAFAAAMSERVGEPYVECKKFHDTVIAQLRVQPPDLVITSQQGRLALSNDRPKAATEDAMVRGLVETWTILTKLGTKVIVILDNLNAKGNPNIYQCVADHPEHPNACAFDKSEAASAAEVQKRAARQVPGVLIVDLNDHICPGDSCSPILGGVLVYRQGSHLTNTYVRTLAPLLDERLAVALAP